MDRENGTLRLKNHRTSLQTLLYKTQFPNKSQTITIWETFLNFCSKNSIFPKPNKSK
jgi:hypothetical protein